jgi:sulfur carrier protein
VTNTIQIRLNGEPKTTTAHTVAELLGEIGAPEFGIAVARNGAVVRKAEHTSTPVNEGDSIEIIRAVQGG